MRVWESIFLSQKSDFSESRISLNLVICEHKWCSLHQIRHQLFTLSHKSGSAPLMRHTSWSFGHIDAAEYPLEPNICLRYFPIPPPHLTDILLMITHVWTLMPVLNVKTHEMLQLQNLEISHDIDVDEISKNCQHFRILILHQTHVTLLYLRLHLLTLAVLSNNLLHSCDMNSTLYLSSYVLEANRSNFCQTLSYGKCRVLYLHRKRLNWIFPEVVLGQIIFLEAHKTK